MHETEKRRIEYLQIDEKTRVKISITDDWIELRMEILWTDLQENAGWHTTSRFLRFPRSFQEDLQRLLAGDPAAPIHTAPASPERN